MSLYSRNNYDTCAIDEQFKRSVAPGNRSLYAGAVVNPKFQDSTGIICEKKSGCKTMSQPNATLGVGQKDMVSRVDLESEMRGITRILSRCDKDEFYPCSMGGSSKGSSCPSIVTFNPAIHDRDLFETNMNVEYEQGFGNPDL